MSAPDLDLLRVQIALAQGHVRARAETIQRRFAILTIPPPPPERRRRQRSITTRIRTRP